MLALAGCVSIDLSCGMFISKLCGQEVVSGVCFVEVSDVIHLVVLLRTLRWWSLRLGHKVHTSRQCYGLLCRVARRC